MFSAINAWVKNNFLYIALLFLITVYTFWDIWFVFYQQDEWKVLGEYFTLNSFWEIFERVNLFKAVLGEGRLLSIIAGFFLLRGFPFESWPLAFYSLAFHFLNSLLVFQLGIKLIGKKVYALISAIFFLVCVVSSSTVSWYSTSIGTLPATTLILLSVLFFWDGISGKRKYLIWGFILLFLSQLFKEIGYFLFLILPVSVFLYQKLNVRQFLETYWYYLAIFFLITIYRITQLNTYSAESTVFTQTSTHNFFLTVILRVILYPFTSLSLIYFPSEFLLRVAKIFTNHYYPFFPTEHYNLIVESAVLDLIAIVLSFSLVLLLIAVSTKTNNQTRKNTFFTVVITLATFLPYVILSKTYSYLDSRYYYLGAAFSGIILGFLVFNTNAIFKRKYISLAVFCLVAVYLSWQIKTTQIHLNELVKLSIERKNVLNQLAEIKPYLGGRNIFLITGDQHYYLAEDNYVPFQQGVGYTILVWLNKDNTQFKGLLANGTLWDLGSQGYFEAEGNGFGYFWDEQVFKNAVKEKNLLPEELTILFYDSKLQKLNSINPEKIW